MNDGEVTADQSQATTAESNSIPPEMEVASQTTAGEPNLSTQQANEPTSEAASQTTIAELSTIYAKTVSSTLILLKFLESFTDCNLYITLQKRMCQLLK